MLTLSLRARILTLVAGFVVMALAIMVFGLVSLSGYSRMMSDYGRAYENAYMGERLNHMMTSSLMESRGLYLSNSPAQDEGYIRNIESDLAGTDALMTQWQAERIASPDMSFDRLAARVHAFVQLRYSILAVTRRSKTEGRALGLTYRPQREALQADIDRVVDQTRAALKATQARADTYRRERMVTFVAATLAWIGVTVLLTLWVISHFITREITRMRAEEERREKLLKQLLDTNTDLERFAYVASHDMLEPVRMVNIYGQMIAEDYRDVVDETGRKYLQVITTSAARMHAMVHDLLQYSRLQHDHARPEAVDLNAELDNVRANLGRLIQDTGARVEAEGLPHVQGNPIQMQRLLGNLVANAIKYQPAGQVPEVRLSAVEDGGQWQVTVADNGIGIDAQFANQIFEPFRRLHTWDQYEGSGMGLAICRKIVERHGGRIWIESRVGEGTRVLFTLPKVVPVAGETDIRSAA